MAVVKVSADGLVTAVSAGNAVVTVKTVDCGMTATISVTVVNPSVNVTLNVNGGNGGNTSTTVKANDPCHHAICPFAICPVGIETAVRLGLGIRCSQQCPNRQQKMDLYKDDL